MGLDIRIASITAHNATSCKRNILFPWK